MLVFHLNTIVIVLVYVFQIKCTTASYPSHSPVPRTNNNDLQVCLSASLPSSLRTVYPCSTLANQISTQYSCDHFNVSTLSAIRGNRISHSPAVIVYVTNSSVVQKVVQCATKLNYIVNALSGGHSYEGYGLGSTDNNIVINMAAMNYISINQNAGTGVFGAGARLGPIYYTAYQYGNYTINGGTCAWVGLGGQILGGGVGLLSRLHGMLSDKVLEMKAVNAQGELLTINETHEPDLYWALRGGGGGLFVIVTEFKIKLVKSPSLVTRFSFVWDHNVSKLVIQRFQSWLFNDKILNSNNNIYWSMIVNNTSVRVSINFYDIEPEEFNITVSLFLAAVPVPAEMIVRRYDWLSYITGRAYIGANADEHRKLLLENLIYPTFYLKAKHLFYDQPISNHSVDQFIDQLMSRDGQIYIEFTPWDGYVSTIPVGNTAFPHRGYKFGIQFVVYLDGEEHEQQEINWLNQVYLSVYEDSAKHSYINFIDRDQSNWMDAYYHVNQQRLIDIKHIYDKDDRFYFDKTIIASVGTRHTSLNFYLAIFSIFMSLVF